MVLFVHSQFQKSDTFVAIPHANDFVAICALNAGEEFDARNAMRRLCSMGAFLIPTRQLRYAVRDGTNLKCADVYDALNGVALPASYTNGPLALCNIVSPNVEIVVDDEAVERTLSDASSALSTFPNAGVSGGARVIRVATMGYMPVWDNTRQTFTLIYNAKTGRMIAAADVSKLFTSLKAVTAASGVDSIVIAFASSVGEGLSKAASHVPAHFCPSTASPTPTLSINSLAFVSSNELFHYVSTVIRLVMSCDRMATYPGLASAERSVVRPPALLVPMLAPVGDALLMKEFTALVNEGAEAKSGETALEGLAVKGTADVAALPFASLKALLEWRLKGSNAPLAVHEKLKSEDVVAPLPGAPSGVIRLRNGPAPANAVAAKYINLAELKLPKGSIRNGTLFISPLLVDYYHYRVDGFVDDGWGCAYRAAQLMLSWLQREGTMKAPTPNIRTIQQVLKEVDPAKEASVDFVGGSEWIGCFEVMLLIQHYCSTVDCVIQRLDSGKELDTNPAVQRLLSAHFEKGGCPVMVGGSSFAGVILGIDVNLRTCEAQYLIADPHYASAEPDGQVAVRKGWVGWKDAAKFFKEAAWYNLCIPKVYATVKV